MVTAQEAPDVREGEEGADAGIKDGEDAQNGKGNADVADYVGCVDTGRHGGKWLRVGDGWIGAGGDTRGRGWGLQVLGQVCGKRKRRRSNQSRKHRLGDAMYIHVAEHHDRGKKSPLNLQAHQGHSRCLVVWAAAIVAFVAAAQRGTL